MAAGGFKEFVAGEVLDEDEINDFLMQGVLVFAGTAARGSAITSPVEGQFAFLKDSDSLTYYSGTAWEELSSEPPKFDFLVIAGGGGGGRDATGAGGGGGAGGYRTSVGTSGGSAVAEPALYMIPGTYTVTVGAGGAADSTGSLSQAFSIVSIGGAYGGNQDRRQPFGGSGGGADSDGGSGSRTGGAGIPGQGRNGGTAIFQNSVSPAAGGGGAQNVGVDSITNVAGNGGAGIASTITGSSVTRAGGGGGGIITGTVGTGGAGGGGNGSTTGTAGSGTVNTGSGGGGTYNGTAGSGGSGLVVLKYPDSITLTIGGGLTSSTTSAGGFKVTTFTAGTDTITVP
jgi:hypothetical protein